MATQQTYYQILGVDRTTPAAEIKTTYRALAREFHPDKNNNDEECKKKFQSINEAYQLLTNNKPNVIYSYDNHLISVLDTLLPFYLRNENI